jgi:hypothetical protein
MERALLGNWFGTVGGESVRLEFTGDGHLNYEISSGGRRQIMLLTYRVDGGAIVTDQPSHPREERTAFRFGARGTLVLAFGGIESLFRRGHPSAN